MKIVLDVVGILLVLAGIVWFLQGIGVLAGGFMSRQTQWAVYGGLTALVGAGLLFYANRRRAH